MVMITRELAVGEHGAQWGLPRTIAPEISPVARHATGRMLLNQPAGAPFALTIGAPTADGNDTRFEPACAPFFPAQRRPGALRLGGDKLVR